MTAGRLISLQEMRDRLTFDDMVDTNAAITNAIGAATHTLETLLRTEFDRQTHVDYFVVTRTAWRPADNGVNGFFHQRLKTQQGFITDTSVLGMPMVAASRKRDLDDAVIAKNLRAYETDITQDLALVDSERGLIYIDELDLQGHYVRVTYTAGFTRNTDEEFELVPDWLREAAYLTTAINLDANPIIRRDDEAPANTDNLRAALADILQTKIRYEPGAYKALRID